MATTLSQQDFIGKVTEEGYSNPKSILNKVHIVAT